MKNFKLLLILSLIVLSTKLAYGSSDVDDTDEHSAEVKQCRLPSGQKIDCESCMQDGGCSKFVNNTVDKRNLFLVRIFDRVKRILGW